MGFDCVQPIESTSHIGVDLGTMTTVGDLQRGIEEAERLLGFEVVPVEEAPGQRKE